MEDEMPNTERKLIDENRGDITEKPNKQDEAELLITPKIALPTDENDDDYEIEELRPARKAPKSFVMPY